MLIAEKYRNRTVVTEHGSVTFDDQGKAEATKKIEDLFKSDKEVENVVKNKVEDVVEDKVEYVVEEPKKAPAKKTPARKAPAKKTAPKEA